MSSINDKNGSRVAGFGLRVMALVAMLAPCALFAGNWTLNTTTKLLESEDGYWCLTNCARSGVTLTVGKVVRADAAADGVLDFRSTQVKIDNASSYVSITTISFGRVKNLWTAAPIREFYADKLDRIEEGIFKGNTTIEKVYINTKNATTAFMSAFEGCTSLREAHFAAPLTGHYSKCFSGCSNLDMEFSEIFDPESGSVGSSSYGGCAKLHGKLTLAKIGNGSSFPTDAFSGSGVEELVITSPNLTSWANGPFKGCHSLTNVTIACPNLESMNNTSNPFSNCTALQKVTFDIPAMTNINTKTSYSHFFENCSAICEVYFKSKPIKDPAGTDKTRSWLNKHVLCNVTPVAATEDAPKNCTIYALRSDYKPYASEMTGDYERPNAPKRCYGVYVSGSSRLAYMVQDPDYRPGFFISAK